MSSQPNPQASALPQQRSIDERHAVETPEQIRLQFTIAGIGSRFLALAIDTALQVVCGIVVGITLVAAGIAGVNLMSSTARLWIVAAVLIFYFVLLYGYFVLFEIFWNGQTPGKRAIGIRVIKDSGRPLHVVESIGRNLMRIVDQLPAFYVVGIVTALCNAQSKRLGDFVAGSMVVQDKGLEAGERPWEETRSWGKSPVFGDLNQMTPEEIALIEAFLARRNELALGTRHRMADEIVARIGRRILITAEQRQHAELTLESLSHQYRQS